MVTKKNQEAGDRSQGTGVRGQEAGVKRQGSGDRRQESIKPAARQSREKTLG